MEKLKTSHMGVDKRVLRSVWFGKRWVLDRTLHDIPLKCWIIFFDLYDIWWTMKNTNKKNTITTFLNLNINIWEMYCRGGGIQGWKKRE